MQRPAPQGLASRPARVFAALIKLDDEAVLQIFTFLAAETLPAGHGLAEALGHAQYRYAPAHCSWGRPHAVVQLGSIAGGSEACAILHMRVRTIHAIGVLTANDLET